MPKTMFRQRTASDWAIVPRLLDEALDRKAWYGPNLRRAIRRVDADGAYSPTKWFWMKA
jgi:hypothetical protein